MNNPLPPEQLLAQIGGAVQSVTDQFIGKASSAHALASLQHALNDTMALLAAQYPDMGQVRFTTMPAMDAPDTVRVTPANLYTAVVLACQADPRNVLPPPWAITGRWCQLEHALVVWTDNNEADVFPDVLLEEAISFIATDQPETCRYCGRRTTWLATHEGRQLHHCDHPECWAIYIVEEEKQS